MKQGSLIILLGCLLSIGCGESAYDKHSDTDEMEKHDTATTLTTGEGTEFIAAPNSANTTRTPVPLDTVVVDTTNNSEEKKR